VEFLANWLVQGSIVVVAAATLLRLLRRAQAHARYWMCLVGFSLVIGLPLVSSLAALAWQEPAAVATGTVSPALVSLPHTPSSHTLIWAAWFVWVGVYGVQLANATVRIVRTRGRFRAFPNVVADRLRHWTQVKEQGRRTRLVLSDDVAAAAVIGGGSPVIAIAPALVEHLTADELDRVVIHEWAHVQRLDDIANVFQLIGRLLAGWHPALWWFDGRLLAEREDACDEIAVRMTGSSKGYAACLLKLASLPLAQRHTAPALGVLSSATLSARIRRIVAHERQGSPTWSRNVASAGIIVLLGVCCGIGSLRIVGAAIVASEPDAPRVVAGSLAPVASSQVASLESTSPPMRDARKASRRVPATPRANVSTVVAPPEGLLTDHAVADVLPVSKETEPTGPPGSQPVESHPAELLAARSIPIPTVERAAPWTAAAVAGITLGERSKKGGLATAAFFTKFSKRIADAF
jgi:beta-lactamase regulating signal transducer with metallopeptidase domain